MDRDEVFRLMSEFIEVLLRNGADPEDVIDAMLTARQDNVADFIRAGPAEIALHDKPQ